MTIMTIQSPKVIKSLKDSLKEKRDVLMNDKKRATAFVRSLTPSSKKSVNRTKKSS